MPSTQPPPRYRRPHPHGVAEKDGHHRLPLADHAPDVGVFRTYAELARWAGLWLLALLAAAAVCGLLVLGLVWLGAHLMGWLIGVATGGQGQ